MLPFITKHFFFNVTSKIVKNKIQGTIPLRAIAFTERGNDLCTGITMEFSWEMWGKI